jgi:hypothetical protein
MAKAASILPHRDFVRPEQTRSWVLSEPSLNLCPDIVTSFIYPNLAIASLGLGLGLGLGL